MRQAKQVRSGALEGRKPGPLRRRAACHHSHQREFRHRKQMPQTEARRQFDGTAKELGMWIHGDGSGNLARVRFVDASGQVFQPHGHAIIWKGWRYVTFPLNDQSASHWGGANNGKVQGSIKLETLFLLDNPQQPRATSGTVYITAATLIYSTS